MKSKELLIIDSFDDFWRVASKLMPTVNPHTRSHSPPPPSLSRPMSTDTANVLDRDGAYSMRSVPVRIYLPDGPVIQEVAPPLREDGKKFHTAFVPI
jgi:autophagy-related protein 5